MTYELLPRSTQEYQGTQYEAYLQARDFFAQQLLAHMQECGGIESWQHQLDDEPRIKRFLGALLDHLSYVVAEGNLQDMQRTFGQYLRDHTINAPSVHSTMGLYGLPNNVGSIAYNIEGIDSPEEAADMTAARFVTGEIALLGAQRRFGARNTGSFNVSIVSEGNLTIMALAQNGSGDGRGVVYAWNPGANTMRYYAGPNAFAQAAEYQSMNGSL